MANWALHGANQWLSKIYNRLHEELVQRRDLLADETTLQVLHFYPATRNGRPIVLFDYQQTRAKEYPRKFLEGFEGELHVGGCPGYNVTVPCQ